MTSEPTDFVAHQMTTPVTVLTGFLGAGKTTLLNRILNGDHGLRITVLVNDFGSINIDADLVVGIRSGGDVISLANGCVCCSIRDDLFASVQQALDGPERPEYIVLEASGVAEPSGIAATFLDARLRDRIRLDSIMSVVDASQIFEAPELTELKLRQIAFADMLILNKVDLISSDEVARIRAWLDEHFHRYRLVESVRGEVPLEILLGVGRFDPAKISSLVATAFDQRPNASLSLGSRQMPRGHATTFSTWSYETDQPISLEALRKATRQLPAGIYRCKGFVFTSDEPSRRTILQVVGKRADISSGGEWGATQPRTRIVVIGAHGAVDSGALRAHFDRCLATPLQVTSPIAPDK